MHLFHRGGAYFSGVSKKKIHAQNQVMYVLHERAMKEIASIEQISGKIYFIRGQRVMLDRDLAELNRVETKRLKEQVRRNIERFPEDFMFELTKNEFEILRSQFASSSWGGSSQKESWSIPIKKPTNQLMTSTHSTNLLNLLSVCLRNSACVCGQKKVKIESIPYKIRLFDIQKHLTYPKFSPVGVHLADCYNKTEKRTPNI